MNVPYLPCFSDDPLTRHASSLMCGLLHNRVRGTDTLVYTQADAMGSWECTFNLATV